MRQLFTDPRSPLVVIALLFGTRLFGSLLAVPVVGLIILPEVGTAGVVTATSSLTPTVVLISACYENGTMVTLCWLLLIRTGRFSLTDLRLRPDTGPGPVADCSHRRGLAVGAAAGLLIFIGMAALGFWAELGHGTLAPTAQTMAWMIGMTTGAFAALMLLLRHLAHTHERTHKRAARVRSGTRTIVIWSGALGAGVVVMALMGRFLPPGADQLPAAHTSWDVIALAIGIVLIAPLAEEFFFRGYALEAVTRWSGMHRAALFTAALFAVVHFQWLALVPIFVTGLVLAAVVTRTGRLWPAVIAHAVNNGLALALTLGA